MATKKKKNPYEEYGLKAAGLSSGEGDWQDDENPYESYGLSQTKRERDPKLVWDWNEKRKEVAQAIVESKKPEEEKKPEPRKRSIWERIGDTFEANSPEDKAKRQAEGKPELYKDEKEKGYGSIFERIGDQFEANSPQDKAKRIAAGKEESYQHQKGLEKEAKTRNVKLNYSKEEVDARRDYFKRQGVDIDKMLEEQRTYDTFKQKYKGQSLARLTLDKNPDLLAAQEYDKNRERYEQIERDFSDFTASQGKEAIPQQINRNFQRGLAEQIVKFPGSARTLAAGAVDLVAPEGSRVDKFAQGQYEAGKRNLEDVDQQIVDQGFGTNPNDNQVVGNLSAGAGSLASSLFLGGAGASGKASQATGWLDKARKALNPGVPGAIFGTNAGAEQYIGAIDAGKADWQAFGTAIVGGAAEGYLEKLGVDKFLGATGSVTKKFLTRAISEGLQEASQSFSQSAVKSTYTSVDFSDALMQALEEGGYGSIIGGGASISMSLAENMVSKGVPEDVAKDTADKVAAKLDKIAQEELPEPSGDDIIRQLQGDEGGQPTDVLPTDGDAIVKALQDDTGGVPVEGKPTDVLPTDGDEIVKALQDEGGQPQSMIGQTFQKDGKTFTITGVNELDPDKSQPHYFATTDSDNFAYGFSESDIKQFQQSTGSELPTSGDAIVKELQGDNPANPPDLEQTEATTDWEENYAEKYGALADEEASLSQQLKTAKSAEKSKLQERIDGLNKQMGEIEQEFQEKWKHTVVGGEEPAPLRPKGSLKPLKITTAGENAKQYGLPDGFSISRSTSGFQGDDGKTYQVVGFAYPNYPSKSGNVRITGNTEQEVADKLKQYVKPDKPAKKGTTKAARQTFLSMMDDQLKGTSLEGAAESTWGELVFTEKTGNTDTLYKTFDESELEDGDRAMEWKQRIKDGERPPVLTVTEEDGERVVDGRHKLWAYRELGIKNVPVINGKPPSKKGAVKSLKQNTIPPEKVLYHATNTDTAGKIRSEGIKLTDTDVVARTFGDGVYLSDNPDTARAWAETMKIDKPEVITVRGNLNILDAVAKEPSDYWRKVAEASGVEVTAEQTQLLADLMLGGEEMLTRNGSSPSVVKSTTELADKIVSEIQKKYDGVKYQDVMGVDDVSYVVFDPKKLRVDGSKPTKGTVKKLGKKADFEIRYPKSSELPERVQIAMRVWGYESEERIKKDKPSKSEVEAAGVRWTRSQLSQLMREIKELKENPVLTVEKGRLDIPIPGRGGIIGERVTGLMFKFESKDGKIKFAIPVETVGFTEERLADAGIKEGDTVNMSEVFKGTGRVPVLRNTKTGADYSIDNPNSRMNKIVEDESSKSEKIHGTTRSVEDLIKLAQDLNKAGQANAMLRRGGSKSKKALGSFQSGGRLKGQERIMLQDAVILDPAQYVSTLAHELSHAAEFQVNGNTRSTYKLFGDLTKEEKTQIGEELKAIVEWLEGPEVVEADPKYYNRPTEQLARYVQVRFLDKAQAVELAPLVTEKYDLAVQQHPELKNLIDALEGELDKGFRNKIPNWYRDLRQTYQKHLGKRAGDQAYNAEVVRRARIQNWRAEVGKLIKQKFKGVKDDPAALFRAAEAIKETDAEGNLVYGTRDIARVAPHEAQEAEKLIKAGYRPVSTGTDHNGNDVVILARQRYTEEEGRVLFEALTPEGQKLVRDFVANRKDAKDFFNREVIKDVFKINSELEGWVHRGLREEAGIKERIKGRMSTLRGKKARLNQQTAGAKKQRGTGDGYLEDFQKQMEKALMELGDAEINNEFIFKQLARISKPIAKGQMPDIGWVEVTADLKKGLMLPGEGGREKMAVLDTDPETGLPVISQFLKPQARYQVPANLAKHYRNIREVPEEMSRAKKIMMAVNKYWAVNVLLHGGTVGTNFIGGGIQYSAKVMNDFYAELLTANVTMPQTRRNVAAMLQVLLPHGWTNTPDYIYGGHRSNYAGQFMTQSKTENLIDKAGDIGLTPFSLVESYWKKVILISEQGHKMDKKQLETEMIEFSDQEQKMLAELNEAVDLYAFDYDNVPAWIENWGRAGGGLVKPFMKYPYKYSKLVTNLATGAFDRTLPVNERAAKLLTLGTLMAISLALMADRDDEKETPDGTEKTPSALNPRGRLFLWKRNGQELFVRTAKYPFINIASTGKALVTKEWEEASNVVTDQLGSIGPAAQMILTGLGYTNKFDQYTAKDAMIGEQAASFIPAFRILNDIGRLMDDKARRPDNFVQGIFSNLPVWGSEETKTKLRGEARTVKIPEEPAERSIAGTTTTEREIKLNNADIILSALTGIYITRIDPNEAKQQQLREQRNTAEFQIRALLTDGKESEAEAKAKEVGLTIPEGTYDYYRRLRSK